MAGAVDFVLPHQLHHTAPYCMAGVVVYIIPYDTYQYTSGCIYIYVFAHIRTPASKYLAPKGVVKVKYLLW